jgi:hypothetical protein
VNPGRIRICSSQFTMTVTRVQVSHALLQDITILHAMGKKFIVGELTYCGVTILTGVLEDLLELATLMGVSSKNCREVLVTEVRAMWRMSCIANNPVILYLLCTPSCSLLPPIEVTKSTNRFAYFTRDLNY